MNKKVLIFTSSIDYTVDYIIHKYQCAIDFFRVNIDMLQHYTINISETMWSISSPNWKVSSFEVSSIYYRKPRLPELNDFEEQYINMIQKDIISLIEGLVNSFEGYVLTKPYILHKCENKVYQLLQAKDIKLLMPQSLITNELDQACEFIKNTSIIKPLTTGKIIFDDKIEIFQTSIIDNIDSDEISLTPIYLQNYVHKDFEVRATFVGEFVYCVKIKSTNVVDWRDEKAINNYEIIDMPNEIFNKCINLLRTFQLDFGAIDFIVDKNGKWIFLEINPNGQWLWLEKELNINISERIINLLNEK